MKIPIKILKMMWLVLAMVNMYVFGGIPSVVYAVDKLGETEVEKEVIPGINIFTSTANPYTFDGDEADISGFTVNEASVAVYPNDESGNKALAFTGSYQYFAVKDFPHTEAERPFKVDVDIDYTGQVRFMAKESFEKGSVNSADAIVIYNKPAGKWSKLTYTVKGTQANSVGVGGFFATQYQGSSFPNLIMYMFSSVTSAAPTYVDNLSIIPYYAVKYDLNGGNGVAENEYFFQDAGTEYTLKNTGADITRDGYVFKGWATKADATEEEVITAVTVVLGEDVTLYAVWEEYIDPGITGSGTATDPYVIDSASDFITFTDNINSGEKYKSKYIVQEVDIDLSANVNYIGTTGSSSAQFSGIYNGNGHTIKVAIDTTGKTLNNTIFPYVNGTIMNLGVVGLIKNDGSYLSGIARSMRSGSKLINCYSNLSLEGKNVGGLTASNYGKIENCYFGGIIKASSTSYGISQSSNGGTYNNCYFVEGCGATTGAGNGATGTTIVTEEEAVNTLADTLNSGRKEAAEVAGVTMDGLNPWINENGYPTMYIFNPKNIKLGSESSMVFEYFENVTVVDEFDSAVIENNGTKNVTITGKGYNGVLVVKNDVGESVAKITIVGGNKWRPGLNVFTGTKEGYDIETTTLFDATNSVEIVSNPTNSSNKVLKISSGNKVFDAELSLGTPIEWDRPYRVDYDVLGKVNGSFKHMMNTTNSDCVLKTYSTSDVSETAWKHIALASTPLYKVNKASHPYLNKFILQGIGVEADNSYALYIDNFSIIPAYKVEYFNDRGDNIDFAFYNPMKADGVEVYLETTYKIDYNPNANYIVNGTPVATNDEYTLEYEDLKVTVLPNDNAIMFSGMNTTIVVPDGDTYVVPYPHELEGFLADDFVVWKDAEGNEIQPGTTVNTADYIGKTIYAYCDAAKYPRSPADCTVVNMGSFRHNSWLANYQPGNIARKADQDKITERGVNFRWEEVPNAVSYTVYYGLDANMKDAKSVTSKTTNIKINHLLRNTKYYWYVESTLSDGSNVTTDVWTFTTADVTRTYSYLNNMRDIGGMVTEDGLYKIKQNMAIRNGVVDSNIAKVKELFGFKTELDLRGSEAGGRTVSPFGEDVKYILIEGTHYFGNSSSTKHYLNPTGQERLKEEVQVFADKNNYPLNFHCSAGRDRTGVIAYIIEGLLGIPEDIIMKDYELSWLSQSAASQANSVTYFGYMDDFHDYINTFEGKTFKDKMENFCLHIGVTQNEIDSIREILLEPVDNGEIPNVTVTGKVELGETITVLVNGEVPADDAPFTYEWYIGDKFVAAEKSLKIDSKNIYPGERIVVKVFFEDGTFASAVTDTCFDDEGVIYDADFEIGSGAAEKYIIDIGKNIGLCNRIVAAYDEDGRMVGADVVNNSFDVDGVVTVDVAKNLGSDYVKVMSFDVSCELMPLTEAIVSHGNE